MASKQDYDKVVGKAARRGRIVEIAAASVNASSKHRKRAMEIARDPEVNKKRAARRFDEDAKASAKKSRKK